MKRILGFCIIRSPSKTTAGLQWSNKGDCRAKHSIRWFSMRSVFNIMFLCWNLTTWFRLRANCALPVEFVFFLTGCEWRRKAWYPKETWRSTKMSFFGCFGCDIGFEMQSDHLYMYKPMFIFTYIYAYLFIHAAVFPYIVYCIHVCSMACHACIYAAMLFPFVPCCPVACLMFDDISHHEGSCPSWFDHLHNVFVKLCIQLHIDARKNQ